MILTRERYRKLVAVLVIANRQGRRRMMIALILHLRRALMEQERKRRARRQVFPNSEVQWTLDRDDTIAEDMSFGFQRAK